MIFLVISDIVFTKTRLLIFLFDIFIIPFSLSYYKTFLDRSTMVEIVRRATLAPRVIRKLCKSLQKMSNLQFPTSKALSFFFSSFFFSPSYAWNPKSLKEGIYYIGDIFAFVLRFSCCLPTFLAVRTTRLTASVGSLNLYSKFHPFSGSHPEFHEEVLNNAITAPFPDQASSTWPFLPLIWSFVPYIRYLFATFAIRISEFF